VANRTSHRYNRLPLLPSGPGGVQQELVVPICRDKGNKILESHRQFQIKEMHLKLLFMSCRACLCRIRQLAEQAGLTRHPDIR